MKNGLRIAFASAALTAGLAFAGASRANAQVSFRGSFPLPHGRISIGIGDPAFRVGAFVPRGYRVYSRPGYGYGFGYRDRWIPVRRTGSQWLVCESPYGYDQSYNESYVDGGYADDVYVAPSYSYARPLYVERPYSRRVYVDRGWNRGYDHGFVRRDFDRRDDHRSDRGGRDGRRSDGNRDRGHDRGHDRGDDHGRRDGRRN
ncbi:MAG: hypothetical protein ABI592_09505 [Acidobacteriota bacterium]